MVIAPQPAGGSAPYEPPPFALDSVAIGRPTAGKVQRRTADLRERMAGTSLTITSGAGSCISVISTMPLHAEIDLNLEPTSSDIDSIGQEYS